MSARRSSTGAVSRDEARALAARYVERFGRDEARRVLEGARQQAPTFLGRQNIAVILAAVHEIDT